MEGIDAQSFVVWGPLAVFAVFVGALIWKFFAVWLDAFKRSNELKLQRDQATLEAIKAIERTMESFVVQLKEIRSDVAELKSELHRNE